MAAGDVTSTRVWEPIADIAEQVNAGTLKAVDLVKKALSLIDEFDGKYSVIISKTDVRALQRAAEIDAQVASGKNAGRLAGVPFIAKDNFLVFGADTTAASKMLKGFDAPYQSTAIERLESEGAICVAKANLDAFAHGASTENSDFQITKNPHDPERVAGGSSGGSAAAVALQLTPFALGTDTGGSIRQPASFCGVVGFKPSYGLISRAGVVAMASSTDVIGALTQTVEDNALVTDVMAGKDPLDGTTIERDSRGYALKSGSAKGVRVGVVKEYFGDGVDPKVAASVKSAVSALEKAGAVVDEVSLPSLPLALAVYYIVVPAELSSNLSRHDGQRYQFSAPDTKTLQESYEQSRSQGFGAEAKRRIMIGTHVLSSGYYDAYYKKAQTVRTKLIQEFKAAFEKFDVLVGPVAPTTAFKIGANSDPIEMYLQDILSVAASLAGISAISVPCDPVDGLPVGFQIMADHGKDRELFELAAAYEELTK